jgi:hypothetical protein
MPAPWFVAPRTGVRQRSGREGPRADGTARLPTCALLGPHAPRQRRSAGLDCQPRPRVAGHGLLPACWGA